MNNEQTNEQSGPVGAVPTGAPIAEDPLAKNWSWGAFILDPFFIIAVRKYLFLLLYLLYFIPFLNFIAMIGIKIFLGLKGAEMVRESETFANDDERRGFLKAIDHAGFIAFIIILIAIAVSLLAAFIGGAFLFSSFMRT